MKLKKRKVKYNKIALRFLKEKGQIVKSGNWNEITPLLSRVTGIPLTPGFGYKASGIAILKKLGMENRKTKKPKKERDVISSEFLNSYAWRKLRMQVLEKYGARCQCCGRTRADGIVIHVDHIKPRRKYPELALDFNNLQVLCEVCNHGKGNWSETDWRSPDTILWLVEADNPDLENAVFVDNRSSLPREVFLCRRIACDSDGLARAVKDTLLAQRSKPLPEIRVLDRRINQRSV